MLALAYEFPDVFEPEAFFASRTLGAGAVYDALGSLRKRCVIETEGRWDETYKALHFDERYVFDDGVEDVMHWAIGRVEGGAVSAHEISVVGPLKSRLRGPVWRCQFRRKGAPPIPAATLVYDASFTQVSPRTVLKTVSLSWRGVPVGTLRGYHQQVD